jgi:tetraprenyl-beta-curcumene synthase
MATECLQSSVWAGQYLMRVRPAVRRELARMQERARRIAEPGPRALALESIRSKQFHCEGGAVLTGGDPLLMRLVVAYQTLCDYLDSITDRGPAVSSDQIRRLHLSLVSALNPDEPEPSYWSGHPWDDGGYAAWLVARCRQLVRELPGWPAVYARVRWLQDRYVDLQSLKHGPDQAVRALEQESWVRAHSRPEWDVRWWEWAAATGSTLGLFVLTAEARDHHPDARRLQDLLDAYFPWMGGLHILLDYFIDQDEDRAGGDFNFVTCYPSLEEAVDRISRLYRETLLRADRLRDAAFHRYVARGLLGFYLADRKVAAGELTEPARRLLAAGGGISWGISALARVSRAP